MFHPVHSVDSACRDTHDLREKDCDAKYTEEGLLATLRTMNVSEYGGEKGMFEITRNVRKISMFFGVAVLKEPLHHAEVFDVQEYRINSTLGGQLNDLSGLFQAP